MFQNTNSILLGSLITCFLIDICTRMCLCLRNCDKHIMYKMQVKNMIVYAVNRAVQTLKDDLNHFFPERSDSARSPLLSDLQFLLDNL